MTWKEQHLHDILACKTTIEAFELLGKETYRLGLQNVSWVIRVPLPLENPRVVIFNTYSKSWQERYWSQNYLSIDPTVRHGLSSMQAAIWSEMRDENPEFWEDAKSYGLVEGIAQSIFDRQGCCSLLSMSRDSLEFTRTELLDKLPKLLWLAQLAHTSIVNMVLQKEVPETAADLSNRERDSLKLAARGLTSHEIAEYMGFSKRTADFHLENARGKLGAENRTDAVVKAVVLGLISAKEI